MHSSTVDGYTSPVAPERLLDRTLWRFRLPEFGDLLATDRVVMEFEPTEPDRLEDWLWLRHLWLGLEPHANVLDAVDRGPGTTVLLRYAAIDWRREPVKLTNMMARQLVATWGAQLTRVYRHILRHAREGNAAHFLRPLVTIDLANNARVGFLPARRSDVHLPAEVHPSWPHCDERDAIFVIGAMLLTLCEDWHDYSAHPIRRILQCCIQPRASRYETLADLETAFTEHAYSDLTDHRRNAWEAAEEGAGWLEVGESKLALAAFRRALAQNPRLRVAKEGLTAVIGEAGAAEPEANDIKADEARQWAEVAATGLELEAAYKYIEALVLYARVRENTVNGIGLNLAIARCQLALRAWGPAIDYAHRALAIDPRNIDALSIQTRGHFLARRYIDSLGCAETWLGVSGSDGSAHYARGRALLALGRFVEARDEFDRACALKPQLLEAMLLRREADRFCRRLSRHVGSARPMELDLPEQLTTIRDALAAGRIDEVIAVLERPDLANDGLARLVHAQCLAFENRLDEAIVMFDRAAALLPAHRDKALFGKARALLALERATEALAALDELGDVNHVDVVELRGDVLQRLGLEGAAEHELGRVAAASASRSDLRIGKR